MIKFTASAELVHLLLAHGFTETTKKSYQNHFAILQRDGYIDGAIKRQFYFGQGLYITFDYCKIGLSEKGGRCHGQREVFSEDEIKSILVYCNLTPAMRSQFSDLKDGPYKLHEKYLQIKENEYLLKIRSHEKLVEAFDKINL